MSSPLARVFIAPPLIFVFSPSFGQHPAPPPPLSLLFTANTIGVSSPLSVSTLKVWSIGVEKAGFPLSYVFCARPHFATRQQILFLGFFTALNSMLIRADGRISLDLLSVLTRGDSRMFPTLIFLHSSTFLYSFFPSSFFLSSFSSFFLSSCILLSVYPYFSTSLPLIPHFLLPVSVLPFFCSVLFRMCFLLSLSPFQLLLILLLPYLLVPPPLFPFFPDLSLFFSPLFLFMFLFMFLSFSWFYLFCYLLIFSFFFLFFFILFLLFFLLFPPLFSFVRRGGVQFRRLCGWQFVVFLPNERNSMLMLSNLPS